ncbi:uncharacterized protein BJ171DRAFT_442631 [Polychytrium aggregatum]|uniref:uncharacterized protein n=1 Tax=Polychytrium aggregatum TaxID=110093 RepID=UPI0022FF03F8|nr:uncharacterized protein BJ171DRAFT_442631 [Polychytrium aggregatum]KAI9204184.1 hypothetical protein BJ171DRAFT_442631 [Polychytrium aggregatum]
MAAKRAKREFGAAPPGGPPLRFHSDLPQKYPGSEAFSGQPDGIDGDGTVVSESSRFQEVAARDETDARMGFSRVSDGETRLGWMVNMHATLIKDPEWPSGKAAVDFYFLEEDGGSFKATVIYQPYFLVMCQENTEEEIEEYFKKRFESTIASVERIQKENLSLTNHLSGNKSALLKFSFHNVSDLLAVRKVMLTAVEWNQKRLAQADAFQDAFRMLGPGTKNTKKTNVNSLDHIIDIREYDVPYYIRAAIDNDFRVGVWYHISSSRGKVSITRDTTKVKRAEPVVLAFDIETTKLPLKFPDAEYDSIMMISYMIDGQGYLITNREIVSEDIENFDYTPKPEYEGPFTVFNEPNEKSVLVRFFEHIEQVKPTVIASYNGDFFDWPFVEKRAQHHGLDMKKEIGFECSNDEYRSSFASHLDCFYWVKRDSYLPQGSQGLKAVTKSKLGYDPLELDPEDMTRFAAEQPQTLAQYSVSDAVATYYLYMKYVNPFIFSLCNIIPMNPDEVLRKGSGTLCETLLMVEAFKANVVMPNKHLDHVGKTFNGHLLESETYVGGHVEALEAGVFRSDISVKFDVVPEALDQLISEVDHALQFSIQTEGHLKMDDVANYDEVKSSIIDKLRYLRDNPSRMDTPLIYHLDVAAMYPNIILTNRLQPDAMVDEGACASCDFHNGGNNTCQRKMTWSWRGEYFPAKSGEVMMIKNQLSTERFPSKHPTDSYKAFHELKDAEQNALLKKRISEYSRKVYHKIHETRIMEKQSIVCQRENPFYINTVRNFRDRRYEYKGLLKTWKRNLDEAMGSGDLTAIDEAKKLIVVYDSLQLAHKCILNSFYGYVMRKGARWYSMSMAGIVCLTGATIIQLARSRVEKVGRPLELDTDGIWCILPSCFPENFKFKLKNGKNYGISYPCVMLNHLVHAQFTNHQYQDYNPGSHQYDVRSENSIFFEVDGPYRAMILPSSTEEDKLLKKRYAVFNDDGSLAELKGFEVKRRGELKLIKIFQSQIFKVFLEGSTLEECYSAVASVANQWLDILFSRGADLNDQELFDLISENRSMSKALDEYGSQKSTSISTAKRLAEFLGDEMVKDKGLNCRFIISSGPSGLPVSERAIPVTIFQAEEGVKRHFLRKWLKDPALTNFDIRTIIDWSYYLERFGSVIQKLITIPAAMQGVANPIPRIKHPEWLSKRVAARSDKLKQFKISDMFQTTTERFLVPEIRDMEDIGKHSVNQQPTSKIQRKAYKKRKTTDGLDNLTMTVADLPENMPDMYSDYRGWLKFQKRKWKRSRLERQGHRFEDDAQTSGVNHGDNARQFFRRQTASIFNTPWEILQVVETDSPGVFRLWVLLHGQQLHNIKITIPRIIYLNSREANDDIAAIEGLQIEKKTKILPRSHPCLHLYEMKMDEKVWQQHSGLFTAMFNHEKIEGTYETQVPLLFRALVKLGCTARVERNSTTSKKSIDELDLDDLTADGRASYLENSSLHHLYLFHSSSGNRHVFALFGTARDRGYIAYVDPGLNRGAIPNLRALYRELREETRQASQTMDLENDKVDVASKAMFQYFDDIEIQWEIFGSSREGYLGANRMLQQYQEERRGPTVLILQSGHAPRQMVEWIPLINDFPVAEMPLRKEDSIFPALGWQQIVTRQMLQHFFNVDSWLSERVAISQSSHVPLCNLDHDYAICISDIWFARKLVKGDMLLWYSSSEKPDLGGLEQDDYRRELDDLLSPEVNVAGAYSNVSMEISVQNIAINTVLASATLSELEGSSDANTPYAESSKASIQEILKNANFISSDHNQVSSHTFGVLRGMVHGWYIHYNQSGDTLSLMLLGHLYRWLSTPTAKFYDRALFELIHGMMKKVYMQLIASLRKLGSTIVYASYEKIVLMTSKNLLATGIAYGVYLVKALSEKPLFAYLKLEPTAFWGYLLWMDKHNLGGLICSNFEDVLDGVVSNCSVAGTLKLFLEWNIQSYLPPPLQQMFRLQIGGLLNEILQFKRRVDSAPRQSTSTLGNKPETDADLTSCVKSYVSQTMKRLMFKDMNEIESHLVKHGRQSDAYAFPVLAGSHLSMKRPELEYAKFVCAVVAIDPAIEFEARLLKRDTMMIAGVKEFSDEAAFQNPCANFVLSQVFCEWCNNVRDVDLTREGTELEAQSKTSPVNQASDGRWWICHDCGTEYDRSMIEQRLIEIVHWKLTEWQLQDTSCVKCRQVKAENMRESCDCGGLFGTVLQRDERLRTLKVVLNIGQFYKMNMLCEVAEWVLAMA